jgi:membrane-bound serine protease (ClpP class)
VRRLLPAFLLSMLASAGLFTAAPAAGAGGQGYESAPRPVHIIEVKGRIDAIVANFVVRSLASAQAEDAEAVVIQLDSPGALIDRQEVAELVFRVAHSSVPVTVWIGPTGARAYGGAARVVGAAAYVGMAPRTKIGRFDDVEGSLGPEAARDRGLVDAVVPTIGEFLAEIDGTEIGGRELDTARVVTAPDGESQTQAAGEVRFGKLPLMERLLHATASPSVAYLLLIVGLALIVFEFFSVGIGVAGATGAVLLALSAYGLAALPTRPLGLALVALGFFGFSVDVQAGAPRAWTAIGTVSLLVGSLTLFGDGIDIPWLTMLVLVVSVVLLMVSGLPSMVRSRFSTPTIGRESMIGAMGEARTAVDPEGTVALRGGLWRARTNRATPIGEGDSIRVIAIDGLLLEVEPEEGGAKDAGH